MFSNFNQFAAIFHQAFDFIDSPGHCSAQSAPRVCKMTLRHDSFRHFFIQALIRLQIWQFRAEFTCADHDCMLLVSMRLRCGVFFLPIRLPIAVLHIRQCLPEIGVRESTINSLKKISLQFSQENPCWISSCHFQSSSWLSSCDVACCRRHS